MIKIIGFARTTDHFGLSPVNYYRLVLPLSTIGLKDNRFDVRIVTQEDVATWLRLGYTKTLMGYNIYAISRLYREEGRQEFIDAVHELGGKIVFDTDDDLTDDFRELGRGDEFKKMISTVDLVTVSTPYLSRRMEPYVGYRPPVLYNHVDFDWFSQRSLQAKRLIPGLTVGFIGTASHEADWHFPVEALARIADEREDITILTAGFVPTYLEDFPNIVKLNPVPYQDYPGLMRQFDIVCCSLDPDDEFNKSKSSIKALECMSAARPLSNGKVGGAVPVCTDMPLYRHAVTKHNGVLADNDGWYEALNGLIDDEQKRNTLAVQGHKWVRKNKNSANGAHKAWTSLYRQVANGGNYG